MSTHPEATGHQHHFLSRLDRLAVPEVELALSLYRDHELIRFLLGELRVPEGAEHVALSLDDPREGPFLIVTRAGRFVTCLGRGMKPGRCFLVARAQLDAVIARHGRLAAAARAAEGKGLVPMLRWLHAAGDAVAREDIAVAWAMQPLYAHLVIRLMIDLLKEVLAVEPAVLAVLRGTAPPSRVDRAVLREVWQATWLLGHLSVLSAHNARGLLDLLAPETVQRMGTGFSSFGFHFRVFCGATRGAWAVGRIGKILLPSYKRAYEEAGSVMVYGEVTLALVLLGLRHARLRAEVLKALAWLPASFTGSGPLLEFVKRLGGAVRLAFERPEELLAAHLARGRKEAVARTAHLPAGSPLRFSRAEDVPEDIAMTMAVNMELDFRSDMSRLFDLYALAPWLARASAEDLYLPRRWVEAVRRPWTVARSRVMLAGFVAQELAAVETRRKQEPPPRKGPCPCGSGKKYKHCCAGDGC